MSYDTAGVANQLVTVLTGLSGMGAVQIGQPESVGVRVSAHVTMGSHSPARKTNGIMQRETSFFVMLEYRLDGAEATAETTLMGLVDAFFQAIQDDLTLGGTVFGTEISSPSANEPEYLLRAGKEYREYPILITVTQRATFEVNP